MLPARLALLAFSALMGAGCQPAATKLEVRLHALPGHGVQVSGETGLPDGAQLNLSLRRTETSEPLVVALPRVAAGRFSAVLDPKRPLPSGDYLVRVAFSPRAFAWSKAVLPAVGANGEKLGGPCVRDTGEGYRVLQLDRALRLP